MRTIILHYHLFKNAGTSLDQILKRNFGAGWVTQEFRGLSNTADVTDWIQGTPDAVAFSSHTMMGPLPQIPDTKIISIMQLRDPIARIRSAYRFEKKQQAETFGAVLAKHTDLEGYVRVRLSLPGDRQCRNFQAFRLASLVPGPEPERARALKALDQLSLVGRVEAFDDTLADLQTLLAPDFPDFSAESVRANVTRAGADEAEDALTPLLEAENADDLAILEAVAARKARALAMEDPQP